jgi:hypothetical protein
MVSKVVRYLEGHTVDVFTIFIWTQTKIAHHSEARPFLKIIDPVSLTQSKVSEQSRLSSLGCDRAARYAYLLCLEGTQRDRSR